MLKFLVFHQGIYLAFNMLVAYNNFYYRHVYGALYIIRHLNFQNEGEINYFTVNVVDNDNNKATNVWSLPSPATHDWAEGRVEVSSNGEKEYQVGFI